MPSKRKVAKKMKRAVNRAKARGHIKPKKSVDNAENHKVQQQPNEMLLKLMAMMNGGRPGGMDPGAFLAASEKRAKDDAEHKKILREKRAERDKAKDAERRAKQEAEEQQADADIEQAKQQGEHTKRMLNKQLEDTTRKAHNNQEILALKEQIAGVQGDIRDINIQNEQALHQINMNTLHGDLEAEKVKRDALERELNKLKASLNYKLKGLLTEEKMELFKNANDKFKQYSDALNELEKATELGHQTLRQQKLVKKHADDIEKELSELLRVNQELKFENQQLQDTIKIDEERIKKVQEMRQENTKLKHELERTKKAAEDSGFVFNRDRNGKLIPVYDERLLMKEVRPEDDEEYQKIHKEAIAVRDHLDKYVANPYNKLGDRWFELYKIFDENPMEYGEYVQMYKCNDAGIPVELDENGDFKRDERGKLIYTGGYEAAQRLVKSFPHTNRYRRPDGDYLLHLDDVAEYLKDLNEKGHAAYNKAKEKYYEAVKHNNEIKSRPKFVKTEITEDDVAKLMKKQDELKAEIESYKRKGKYRNDLILEFEKLSNTINRLEAQIKNTNPDVITPEQLKVIAQLKTQHEILKRQLEVNDKQRKRVEKVQDDAADMQFDNKLNNARLTESPKSKSNREEAQNEAIKAKVEAERQNQLNEIREMTHKSEQDKRMAEMKENVMNSERNKELEQEMINETAKGQVAEEERKQYEALARVRENTRYKHVAREAQKKFNEHLRSGGGGTILDAATQLVVLGKEIDNQIAESESLKKDVEPLIERFSKNPDQFKLFNEEALRVKILNKGFESVDELRDGIFDRGRLNTLKNFFKWYDDNHNTTNDDTSDEE